MGVLRRLSVSLLGGDRNNPFSDAGVGKFKTLISNENLLELDSSPPGSPRGDGLYKGSPSTSSTDLAQPKAATATRIGAAEDVSAGRLGASGANTSCAPAAAAKASNAGEAKECVAGRTLSTDEAARVNIAIEPFTADTFEALVDFAHSKNARLVYDALKKLQYLLQKYTIARLKIRACVINTFSLRLCTLIDQQYDERLKHTATLVLALLYIQANVSLDRMTHISKVIQNQAMNDFSQRPRLGYAICNLLSVFTCRTDSGEQCARECNSIIFSIIHEKWVPTKLAIRCLITIAHHTSTALARPFSQESFEHLVAKLTDCICVRPEVKGAAALVLCVEIEVCRCNGNGVAARADFYLAKAAAWLEGFEWENAPDSVVKALDQFISTNKIETQTITLNDGSIEKLTTLGAVARTVFWQEVLGPTFFPITMNHRTLAFKSCFRPFQSLVHGQPAEAEDSMGEWQPKKPSLFQRMKRRNSTGVTMIK